MINHFKQYWKVYIWCALITILSCIPVDNEGPGWFNFQHADKILHVLFYGIFSALIIMSILQSTGNQYININTIIIVFVLVLCYGSLMEIIQHYLITSRTGDLIDIVFNLIGWVIATVVLYLKTKLFKKNR